MAKFTSEQKVQIVLKYLKGVESIKFIANKFRVSTAVLTGWVRLYEQYGKDAFIKSYTNYSVEFKLYVLNYMYEMGASSYDTAAIFNVSSPSMIRKWRRSFETGGVDALLSKKKGRLSMKKESKLTKAQKPLEGSLEALRAENERLRLENAYLKKLNALVQEKEKLQIKSRRK